MDANDPNDIEVLTIEQAAARRGCSASTIWRRVRAGELQPRRFLGRVVFDATKVDALTVPATGGRWRTTAQNSLQNEEGPRRLPAAGPVEETRNGRASSE